jgi:hypothetical protein
MLSGRYYYKSPIECNIKPGRIIYLGKVYTITQLHKNYHVNRYYIVVNNKKENLFEDLILSNCFHPNAFGGTNGYININSPPKYSKFCLPDWVFGAEFIDSKVHQKIIKGLLPKPNHNIISDMYIRMAFLSVWVLDNPHHQPISDYVKTEPKLPFF